MTRTIRTLVPFHLGGNALLLLLGYYWLGIPESRAATLVWSIFVALVLLCGACWLHGASFAFFREGTPAFRRTLRMLFPIVIAALAVLALYALLSAWADYSERPAASFASWLTSKFRKPVKPAAILRTFNLALWIVRWMVVPVFVLPLIADIATDGWSGMRSFGRLAKSWRYWLAVPVLLVVALRVPLLLAGWVPQIASFGMQMASFLLRAGVAYLLFTVAWLLLVFMSSGGKPVLSQPTTVPKP
jgi:hypothetical protein